MYCLERGLKSNKVVSFALAVPNGSSELFGGPVRNKTPQCAVAPMFSSITNGSVEGEIVDGGGGRVAGAPILVRWFCVFSMDVRGMAGRAGVVRIWIGTFSEIETRRRLRTCSWNNKFCGAPLKRQ